MRPALLALISCLVAFPAAGQVAKKAPAGKGKAKAAKVVAPKPEEGPLPPEAQKRVALVEPAVPKGFTKVAIKKAMEAVDEGFKGQGYETVPSAQVTAQHLKRKLKVPVCNDDADCLAKVGKVAGAGYVANVSINPSGKTWGVKLTVVDTNDAAIVSNNLGFVTKPDEKMLSEAMKKQVQRAGGALGKRLAEKEAAAAAAVVATAPAVTPEPKPEPKPEPEPMRIEPPVRPEPVAQVEPSQPAPDVSAPTTDAPLAEPPVTVRSSSGPGPVPWVLVGAGAVAIGVGYGVFGLQAQSAVKDYKAGKDAAKSRDNAKQSALIADVTAGAGAVLMVVGVGMLIYSAASDAPPAVQASVAVTPEGAGLALSGSF